MFTLGGTELLLLGVLVLLLFGPEKVPQLARTLGRAMREFNKYKDIMESAFRVEMQAAEKAASPEAGADDSLERLERAAAASREYAVEHGALPPDSVAAEGAEDAPGEEAAPAQDVGVTVTDEDEEEG